MYRALCVSVAALALAGCAASEPAGGTSGTDIQTGQVALDDVLNTPLDADAYGAVGERCLSTYAYRTVEVLDDRHVLFKGNGGRRWLNRLQSRCAGLQTNEVLQFQPRHNRVCHADGFRSYDRAFTMAISSASCTLGEFHPVTRTQLRAIEVALEG